MWPWNVQHHQLFRPESRWMDFESFVGDATVVKLKTIWYLLIIIPFSHQTTIHSRMK